MCGILDANAAHEVFGRSVSQAGQAFRDWINSPRGTLVVGGKLLAELRLAASVAYEEWAEEAILDGRLHREADVIVDAETMRLTDSSACRSDDQHVVALATVSGARLLYSHDADLQADFKNRQLLSKPPGKVLPTGSSAKSARQRHQLLQSGKLCRADRCRRRKLTARRN